LCARKNRTRLIRSSTQVAKSIALSSEQPMYAAIPPPPQCAKAMRAFTLVVMLCPATLARRISCGTFRPRCSRSARRSLYQRTS
jgi:hypothetical protein